jgi:hypothetical protein
MLSPMTPVGDAPVIDEVNLDVDHNDAPLHDGAIYDAQRRVELHLHRGTYISRAEKEVAK